MSDLLTVNCLHIQSPLKKDVLASLKHYILICSTSSSERMKDIQVSG